MRRNRSARWVATARGMALALLLGAFMLVLTGIGNAALERGVDIGHATPMVPAGAQNADVPPTPTPVP
jgi:hypothetical protein